MVAQQIADAGGPIAYEWRELAPVGRPHLYPPLLHLLIAALLKAGCHPGTAMRLISVLSVPALLLSLFLVMRRLLGRDVALASLWMAMIPWSFHLQGASALAATLGMIELLWLMEAMERRRIVAAGLLLGLLGYTHLGLPWIACVMLALIAWWRPTLRAIAIRSVWGAGLWLPWLWHLVQHRASLQPFARYENVMVVIVPGLYLMAAVGFWRCWWQKERWLWLIACWAGFLLLAPQFRYRWLSGEGLLPIVLFAGVGLKWLSGMRGIEWRRLAVGGALFLGLLLSPAISHHAGGWRWSFSSGGPLHLLVSPSMPSSGTDMPEMGIDTPRMQRLAKTIGEASHPDDILWSNADHALGWIAVLAHRATSTAMLAEMAPSQPFDPYRAASMLVVFRGIPMSLLRPIGETDRLQPVFEDDLVSVKRRLGVTTALRRPQRVLPLWLARGLVAAALAGIVWDERRPFNDRSR